MKLSEVASSLSQGNFTASATCPEMMFVDYLLVGWTERFSGSKWQDCYRPTTDIIMTTMYNII